MINWEESIKEIVKDTFPVIFEFVDESFFRLVYRNNTEINIFMVDKRKRLVDIVYWNENGVASIDDFGMYFNDGEYSRKNLELLREILKVPLNRGWTEIQTKTGGRTIKTEVFYGLGEDMDRISYHTSANQYYGCLSLFSFPFRFLYNRLSASVKKTEVNKKEIYPALRDV